MCFGGSFGGHLSCFDLLLCFRKFHVYDQALGFVQSCYRACWANLYIPKLKTMSMNEFVIVPNAD